MKQTIKQEVHQVALSGELSTFSLVRILQFLNQSQVSGVLQVKRGALYGVLYFDNGEIIDAHVLMYQGEDALYEIFLWLKGSFAFYPMQILRNRIITRPTEDLILTGSRYDQRWRQLCTMGINSNTILKSKSKDVIDRMIQEEEEGTIHLAQADQEFLKATDGTKTLRQIAQKYGYNRRKLVTILSFLLANGFIDIVSSVSDNPFGTQDNVFMPELDN